MLPYVPSSKEPSWTQFLITYSRWKVDDSGQISYIRLKMDGNR